MGLIFGLSDTLLAVRTGEGKSLIYQGFVMLTGLIGIQVTLLNRLGVEQASDSARMNANNNLVNVLIINEDTKKLNPKSADQIRQAMIQHIIAGPEQLCSPAFLALLREISNRVGAIIIDEVHTVEQ